MRVFDLGGDMGPAHILSIDDELYPPLLREIHDPPTELYVRGDPRVLAQPQIAIVGSRRASSAGLRIARDLALELGRAGLRVCSGLALGIDGAAHRGALAGASGTVAVMATGIEAVYPKRHAALAVEIMHSGCLVTEFSSGMPPLRENFPRRNRLVSGLSLGVVVVEAALPSGSLITARTALEQGREVFALPWSPLHDGGAGCLKLLREGAKMVLSVDDILEELGPLYAVATAGSAGNNNVRLPGATASNGLLELVGYEAVTVDDLVQSSALSTEEVLRELTRLEVEGRLSRVDGGYIRR